MHSDTNINLFGKNFKTSISGQELIDEIEENLYLTLWMELFLLLDFHFELIWDYPSEENYYSQNANNIIFTLSNSELNKIFPREELGLDKIDEWLEIGDFLISDIDYTYECIPKEDWFFNSNFNPDSLALGPDPDLVMYLFALQYGASKKFVSISPDFDITSKVINEVLNIDNPMHGLLEVFQIIINPPKEDIKSYLENEEMYFGSLKDKEKIFIINALTNLEDDYRTNYFLNIILHHPQTSNELKSLIALSLKY